MNTFDRIDFLLKQKKLKQIDLTNYLGIPKTSYTDWKTGRTKSYQKHLPQIASFFNVSVDYLLGKPPATFSGWEASANAPEDLIVKTVDLSKAQELLTPRIEKEKKLLTACKSLSDEELDKVIDFAEFLSNKK